MTVETMIRDRLAAALAPTHVEVIDESWRHVGHAGARPEGETHFRVTIVAAGFAGQSRLERQRRVYAALGDLMPHRIHALSVRALTPDEAAGNQAGRDTERG